MGIPSNRSEGEQPQESQEASGRSAFNVHLNCAGKQPGSGKTLLFVLGRVVSSLSFRQFFEITNTVSYFY
jgi:hypothetical protein